MFKSANRGYTSRFVKHLKSFIESYQLFKPDDDLLITVSGGLDSMALGHAITALRSFGYSNKIRFLHIHHNTRSEQDSEAELVMRYGQELGGEVISEKLEGLDIHRNFEYRARLKRYEVFYHIATPQEKILLAHHIDDSFEWTLLQSLRSSSINGLIGIPVVNDRVIRPFMCVTKEQVRNYVKFLDLPFLEDPTNEQLKYERNYLRHQVINAFEDRYKNYLRHYVYRHNEIARRLGVHLIENNKSDFHLSVDEKSVLIFSTKIKSDFSGIEQLIEKGVKHLLPGSRGTLSLQLSKIKGALQNHKQGPLTLTEGLKAYLDYNLVLLTKEKSPPTYPEEDYQTYSWDEFHSLVVKLLRDPGQNLAFPFFVELKGNYLDKRQFKTTFSDKASGYPALRLLREWSKKRNMHKVLRLKLMLVKK